MLNCLGKLEGDNAGMEENVCVCVSTLFAGKCFFHASMASLKMYAWIHSIIVLPRIKFLSKYKK